MAKLTITEALAEIPTLQKRIEKKREFILAYLYRQANTRDPHEKDGGSAALVMGAFQSITDLEVRLTKIRAAIAIANQTNVITINGTTMSIADWLTFKREIAPNEQQFLANLSNRITQLRSAAARNNVKVTDQDPGFSADFVVNISEKRLAEEIEKLETTLGLLDGQLSLKNATITIDI